MDIVDLQRPDLLPDLLKAHLNSIKEFCRNEEFSEELVVHPEVRAVVHEIDNYCLARRILGIHYTHAIRTDIEREGLLVRTGSQIRDDFVRRFGHRFQADELAWLRDKWASHQVMQSAIRDSMLWFNFTLNAYGGSGSEYLLAMYGGEQIHMGIEIDTPIGRALASIGEPLLVKCALDPKKVDTFIENPWGKILVSSFHVNVRRDAFRIGQDGKVTEPIHPKDLIVEPAH